ncbi:hypothetical protein HDU86_005848 [Geranomyces michiganensis]|nr:hypothetical protein HDU86_005848 [Geranomyces michiganensis]
MSSSTPPTSPPLSEWQPIFDDASQLYYWWNIKTNETSWTDPSTLPSSLAPFPQVPGATSSAESDSSVTPPAPEKVAEGVTFEKEQVFLGPKPSCYYQTKEYYDWYHANVHSTKGEDNANRAQLIIGSVQSDYTTIGAFSTRSGRFQNVDRNARFAAPEKYYDQSSKAMRQLGSFFDYEKFQAERAAERMTHEKDGGKVNPPTLTKKQVEFYKKKKKMKKLSSLRSRFGGD